MRSMRSSVELKLSGRMSVGIRTPGTPGTPNKRSRRNEVTSEAEDSRIRVGVRVRPPGPDEVGPSPLSGGPRTVRADGVSYEFDRVFWPECPQREVYEGLAEPLLGRFVAGYNVCLFAYGRTGSGKTHSMTGADGDPGAVPRFCQDLFRRDRFDSTVALSYFEIYNEKIRDLLADKDEPLRIREHPHEGPYVENLTSHPATSAEETRALLRRGDRRRTTAPTARNERSSRSHAILRIAVSSVRDGVPVRPRASLVDLAGSERPAEGRFKEGLGINVSLLTLGKVIACLSEGKRSAFAPYRDSTLTWLLKENLGENSCTAMLATVSPDASALEETLATLRYACRARRIVNRVSVNEDPQCKTIRDLKKQIEILKSASHGGPRPDSNPISNSPSEGRRIEERLQAELRRLTSELGAAEKRRDELENQKNSHIINIKTTDVAEYESDFMETLQGILNDSDEGEAASNRNEYLMHLRNIKQSIDALREMRSIRADKKMYQRILPLLVDMKKLHQEVLDELAPNSEVSN